MSKKNIIVMIIAIIVVAILWLFTTGFFNVNSSLKDIFSFSKAKEVAQNAETDWKYYMPNNEMRTPYFIYDGEKDPQPRLYMRAVIHISKNGKDEIKQIEGFLSYDKHFFVGEQRWYIPEEYNYSGVTAVYYKITYKEYKAGEEYIDYVYSDKLTQKEIAEDRAWVDSDTLIQ